MKFGTAVRDITPKEPVWLHGYSTRERKSEGISEALEMACLALADKDKTVLIFTFDLIGIRYQDCRKIYETLENAVGIGFPDIMLSCSHTHFAPALHPYDSAFASVGFPEPEESFVEDFYIKIVEAAKESLRNLRDGVLETARIKVPQLLFNRRTIRNDGQLKNNYIYPENPGDYNFGKVDDELTVLRFKDNYGNIGAVLANFGCHPVTGGEEREVAHYRVSSDYPHYLRKKISATCKCPAFFTLGGAGDAVPLRRYGKSRERIGGILGESILHSEPLFVRDPGSGLLTASVEHRASVMTKFEPATAKKEYEEARRASLAKPVAGGADSRKNAELLMTDPYVLKATAYERVQAYPDNCFDIPLQFIKIGKTVLVSWPFEIASELTTKLKIEYPNCVPVSCCGGYQGYLFPTHEFRKGGYEVSFMTCHFEKTTAEALLGKSLDWLNKYC
ncbi:MAG: neutral/alkaline non-lysosomal ceramidase N-terminal domain-containing protein [Victivallaceae bacterium]